MFEEMGTKLPFSPFISKVLRVMTIAPTQLQPNSWAFLRCFEIVCEHFNFIPSYKLFFFFYKMSTNITVRSSHISLSARNSTRRFNVYSSHAKNWQGKFFKIFFPRAVLQLFSFPDGRPKFPFYWTERPKINFAVELTALTLDEQKIISFLSALPIIDSKELLGVAKGGYARRYLNRICKCLFYWRV